MKPTQKQINAARKRNAEFHDSCFGKMKIGTHGHCQHMIPDCDCTNSLGIVGQRHTPHGRGFGSRG